MFGSAPALSVSLALLQSPCLTASISRELSQRCLKRGVKPQAPTAKTSVPKMTELRIFFTV